MKTPRTPSKFPYDLWVDQDGRYMVKVKLTGEIVAVSHEVMKELRREEKEDRRDIPSEKDCEYNTLSLDCSRDTDEVESWIVDPHNMQEEIIARIMEEEFCGLLTLKQLDVYLHCLKAAMTNREYAKASDIDPSSVRDIKKLIQKKYKKFFQ